MDTLKALAAVLRNFAAQPSPVVGGEAKDALGQSGAAARANGSNRDAYLAYAERELAEGRQPVRYDQWIAMRDPLTSQVQGN